MAYLRSITHECQAYGCKRTAVVQLHNYRNAPMGTYCAGHGPSHLAAANRREQDEFQAERKAREGD